MDAAGILLIALFAGTAVLLLAGFPVAFTLAGTAILVSGLASLSGIDPLIATLPERIYGAAMRNDVLVAVPLFVFMGLMLERSRIADDLLNTMGRLFGRLRGGLGVSVVIVGALLAASTGIVGATVATMGLLSLPAMLRQRYDPDLACGTICAAGTLGQIIPPSIVLVILGDQISAAYQEAQNRLQQDAWAQGDFSFSPQAVSVGDLFAAALLPGFVLVAFYVAYLLSLSVLRPSVAPPILPEPETPSLTLGEALRALLPPLVLIVAVLGSILAGIAPPSEAAGIGAVGATLLAGLRTGHRADPGDSKATPLSSHSQVVAGLGGFVLGGIAGAAVFEGSRHFNLAALTGSLSGAAFLVLAARRGLLSVSLKRLDPGGATPIALGCVGLIAALILTAQFDLRANFFALVTAGLAVLVTVWAVDVAFYRCWAAGILVWVNRRTLEVCAMIFSILIGAALFSLVFRSLGGDDMVRALLSDLPGGTFTALLVVMLTMFLMGFFLDFLEITFVVVPIVAPVLLLDPQVSPVWLGVLMAVNLQTSFLTPPFGFALFYLRGVAPVEVSTGAIYRGALPFVGLQVVALATVWAVPSLSEWLPEKIFGLSFRPK